MLAAIKNNALFPYKRGSVDGLSDHWIRIHSFSQSVIGDNITFWRVNDEPWADKAEDTAVSSKPGGLRKNSALVLHPLTEKVSGP